MDSGALSECVILFWRQRMARDWLIIYWSFINTETDREKADTGGHRSLWSGRRRWNDGTEEDRASERAKPKESFAVQKHQLDTNHHVNNCQYILNGSWFSAEDFPRSTSLWSTRDRLSLKCNDSWYMEANKATVVLNAEDQEPYAVVEFTKVIRAVLNVQVIYCEVGL